MHYYSHHIGDFIKKTSNLDDHHLATYLRMLWEYYSSESPFKDDCESIAFAMRSDEKTVGRILSHYFTLGEDGWHHDRCDEEIAIYHGKAEKARASANARWKNANALPSQSSRNANEPVLDANQEPRTKNQEEAKEKKSPAKPAVSLIPELPEKLMRDFLAIRKAKKQPLTETAVEGIRREAGKAGIDIESAIKVCCENGWAGFKASWDWQGAGKSGMNGSNGHTASLPAGGGRKEL